MRQVTFNKLKCYKCKKNTVEAKRWMLPCTECLSGKTQGGVTIAHRQPAAVIEQNGKKIFVDKFGKEVTDHGYDLENDPRGNIPAGKVKTLIVYI